MKMVFVDAENVGLKEIEKLAVSAFDKVFVFSKSETIKLVCEKSLFLYLSGYPSGQNQADFYIIGYLSRVLCAIDKKQLGSVNFELYSNDESLASAFEFQCLQLGAQSRVIRTKENKIVSLPIITKSMVQTPEAKIYAALKEPCSLDASLQTKLGLSKPNFTKAVNELSKSNKIVRSAEDKKKWVRNQQ
ncbi:hypothetical protein [Vibrio sp. 99-70-13A1]|uniref:hypothetical protein n=1 Tax=Vibrio sp. 99-70-13A1 TaxID=2607601 RepID=UPI0014934E72|nr:hypothetical protein [Vibrio sp. 99-70-13A1]NOH99433.1 hypothetical protein [Vibrio sp. 99-70-13A1]